MLLEIYNMSLRMIWYELKLYMFEIVYYVMPSEWR